VYANLPHLLAALYVPGFAEHVTQHVDPLAGIKPTDPKLN
jgi:hypothetical protein